MNETIVKTDDAGNIIYRRFGSYECWYEYDKNGNVIHTKNSDGFEEWYKYDKNGNQIHYKDTEGCEEWYEYDCDGNIMNYKKHIEEKEYHRDLDCTCCIITNIEKQWYPGKIK